MGLRGLAWTYLASRSLRIGEILSIIDILGRLVPGGVVGLVVA